MNVFLSRLLRQSEQKSENHEKNHNLNFYMIEHYLSVEVSFLFALGTKSCKCLHNILYYIVPVTKTCLNNMYLCCSKLFIVYSKLQLGTDLYLYVI